MRNGRERERETKRDGEIVRDNRERERERERRRVIERDGEIVRDGRERRKETGRDRRERETERL